MDTPKALVPAQFEGCLKALVQVLVGCCHTESSVLSPGDSFAEKSRTRKRCNSAVSLFEVVVRALKKTAIESVRTTSACLYGETETKTNLDQDSVAVESAASCCVAESN